MVFAPFHSPVFGIDLGTTQCRVCYSTATQAPTPVLFGAQHTLPTVLYFPETTLPPPELLWHPDDLFPSILVGEEALAALLHNPSRGAILFKRNMGDSQWYVSIDDAHYSSEDLATFLLASIRRHLEQTILPHLSEESSGRENTAGISPLPAVITVPSYFPETARRATQQAATRAGFRVLGLLNEPTAAALAYGYSYTAPAPLSANHPSLTNPLILVFDMGGGTTDISLLRLHGQDTVQVVASLGNLSLGCQDFDDQIATQVANSIEEQQNWNPLDDPEAFEHLRRSCRTLRENLSHHAQVSLDYSHPPFVFHQLWTQEQLHESCFHLLASCRELLQELLQSDAVLKVTDVDGFLLSQIDKILLAGGGSRMPMIQSMFHDIFGKAPDMSLDPAMATATGATQFARYLQQQPPSQQVSDASLFLPGQFLIETCAYPLGLLYLDHETLCYRALCPQHTPLPTTFTLHGLTTTQNNQTVLDLVLTQDSPLDPPQFDTLLSTYRLFAIPEMPANTPNITATVVYAGDGIIHVTAREEKSQQDLAIQVYHPLDYFAQLRTENIQDILFLVDTSASMEGRLFLEAKYALLQILQMLEQHQFTRYRVGIISFGARGVQVISGLQSDFSWLRGLISQLTCGGNTPMHIALDTAGQLLRGEPSPGTLPPKIILLSDGKPSVIEPTERAAASLHQQGVQIVALDLGETTNLEFLRWNLCSSPSLYYKQIEPIALPLQAHLYLPALLR